MSKFLPNWAIRMSLVLFLAACRQAAFADCNALSDVASGDGVFVPSDDSGRVVIGGGRLQFYAAPDYSCPIAGVFIVEGQVVNAYTEYREFTSDTSGRNAYAPGALLMQLRRGPRGRLQTRWGALDDSHTLKDGVRFERY